MEYIVAVDLGTTKVLIAVAQKMEDGKIELLSLKETASEGVIKGDVRNLEQAHKAIAEVKRQVEEELNISIKEVLVGISGKHIECVTSSGYIFVNNTESSFSEITALDVERLTEDMRKSSTEMGKRIIDVIPQTYKVDEESDISDPVGIEGKRLEAKFNIIVGEEASIERLRRCFHRAGLEIVSPILQPLASSEAVLSDDEKELGVAVIDIGGGTTDLCIYYDKIIRHIAVIPIGGSVINNDIKNFGVLNKHVEALKIKFGEAIASKAPADCSVKITGVGGGSQKHIEIKALAGIIEARMYDIIEYVKHEIDTTVKGFNLGAGIVLTGGGSMLKNLDVLFKQKLNLEVRVANPYISLTPESIERVTNPKYSTLIGLIIDGFNKGLHTSFDVVDVDYNANSRVETSSPTNNHKQSDTSLASSAPSNDAYYDDNNNSSGTNEQFEYEEELEYEKPKKRMFSGLKTFFNNIMTEKDEEDEQDNY